MQILAHTKSLFGFLAKPDILFYALPWLMVLTVLGTVSQKDIGLYEATQTYLHSIILWLGPVPTPGGLTIIALIFLSLTIKFLFFSKWNRQESGIILTHLGILMLLLGGIITIATTKEGFMIIPEGDSASHFGDYRQRVLTLAQEDKEPVIFNFEDLKKDQEINIGEIKIKLLDLCENCAVQSPTGKYENLKGLAKNMELYAVASAKNKEENFSGLTFTAFKGEKTLGTYIVMEDIPRTSEVAGIETTLGRAQTRLPFTISLQDFRQVLYDGTVKPRDYESDLIVDDNGVSWPVTIRMNEPLRYKGYTFYQSSFDQTPQIEITVLNVVKNEGRLFPYIASFIIFAGLLLHFFIRIKRS